MRLTVKRLPGGAVVLDDAYNSNPMSALSALCSLSSYPLPVEAPAARRVALLGDMLELGSEAAALHEQTLEVALATSGVSVVGVAGELFCAAAAVVREGKSGGDGDEPLLLCAPDSTALGALAAAEVRSGDVVLLKGSRGVRMERALDALTAAAAAAK